MEIDQIINSVYQSYQKEKPVYRVSNDEAQEDDETVESGTQELGSNSVSNTVPEAQKPVQMTTPATQKPAVTTEEPATTPENTTTVKDPADTVETTAPTAKGEGGKEELMNNIADKMIDRGKSELMIDELAEMLKEEGMEARVVGGKKVTIGSGETFSANGTIEITTKDGTQVKFKDINGDGGIGLQDTAFKNELKEIVPDKFGEVAKGSEDARTAAVKRAS
jgi:hypothetical protein